MLSLSGDGREEGVGKGINIHIVNDDENIYNSNVFETNNMYDEEGRNPIFENVNQYKENIFNNPPFSFSSPTGNSFSNNDTTTLGGSTTNNSIRGENKSNAKTSGLDR